jgi:hypothetical protein
MTFSADRLRPLDLQETDATAASPALRLPSTCRHSMRIGAVKGSTYWRHGPTKKPEPKMAGRFLCHRHLAKDCEGMASGRTAIALWQDKGRCGKKFASWAQKAYCCARLSPFQVQEWRVLECSVLCRSVNGIGRIPDRCGRRNELEKKPARDRHPGPRKFAQMVVVGCRHHLAHVLATIFCVPCRKRLHLGRQVDSTMLDVRP